MGALFKRVEMISLILCYGLPIHASMIPSKKSVRLSAQRYPCSFTAADHGAGGVGNFTLSPKRHLLTNGRSEEKEYEKGHLKTTHHFPTENKNTNRLFEICL